MSFGRGSSSVRIRGREREVEFVVEVEGVPRFVVLPPWGFFESFFGIRSIDEKGAIGELCSICEAVRKAKNSRRKKLFQAQKKRQTSFKVGGGAKCLRLRLPVRTSWPSMVGSEEGVRTCLARASVAGACSSTQDSVT